MTQLNVKIQAMLDANKGVLPKFTDMGGYPLFYSDRDNLIICPDCANDAVKELKELGDEYIDCGELPVDAEINYEDARLHCEDCGDRIESAYAEDEAENEKESDN